MNKRKSVSRLGNAMVAGLSEFSDAIEAGEAIEQRFTVRTATLDLHTKNYRPNDVKRVRKTLNASQVLLAKFLGVSPNTVRSWEQGTRPVPMIACRYMDDLLVFPELWKKRIRVVTSDDAKKTIRKS